MKPRNFVSGVVVAAVCATVGCAVESGPDAQVDEEVGTERSAVAACPSTLAAKKSRQHQASAMLRFIQGGAWEGILNTCTNGTPTATVAQVKTEATYWQGRWRLGRTIIPEKNRFEYSALNAGGVLTVCGLQCRPTEMFVWSPTAGSPWTAPQAGPKGLITAMKGCYGAGIENFMWEHMSSGPSTYPGYEGWYNYGIMWDPELANLNGTLSSTSTSATASWQSSGVATTAHYLPCSTSIVSTIPVGRPCTCTAQTGGTLTKMVADPQWLGRKRCVDNGYFTNGDQRGDEGTSITLGCGTGKVIQTIDSAYYGDKAYNSACAANPGAYGALTRNIHVEAQFRALCLGKSSCTVAISNATFGSDPAYGSLKCSRVNYACL